MDSAGKVIRVDFKRAHNKRKFKKFLEDRKVDLGKVTYDCKVEEK